MKNIYRCRLLKPEKKCCPIRLKKKKKRNCPMYIENLDKISNCLTLFVSNL